MRRGFCGSWGEEIERSELGIDRRMTEIQRAEAQADNMTPAVGVGVMVVEGRHEPRT